MTSKEIKYILDHVGKKSPEEIAGILGLKERKVRRFIESNAKQKEEKGSQQAGAPARQVSHYFKFFAIVLISSLGIVVYSNTFSCPFHFDDFYAIVDNSFIRNIHDLQNIWKFYPSRFVIFLSIAFNYCLSGLDVFGYHIFNLAVHLVSACFVWWFTLLTLSTPVMKDNKITRHVHFIALFAGLVFVSHPVQTEAVTYIWQRAASLVALFYMASLCFYVQSRLLQISKPNSGLGKFYYICALITAIAAMFTKENAVTLPLAILLYEFSFFNAKKNFNWGCLIPFLLTIFIIPLTISLTKSEMSQNIHGVVEGATGISPMQYLLTQFRVIATYIRLVFVPINQNLDYDFPIYNNILELPVLAGFLFLTAILYIAQRLFSKYRLVSFSIFWFFLTLLPESSFLPLHDVIFEHRLYLPLVGYSLFLVSGVYYLFGKNNIKMMVMALTVVIIGNSVLTYQRNKVWKDDLTLWNDTVRKSPHKARPYNSRGYYYERQGDLTKAMSDYNKAIEINPDYAEAYNNRSHVYYSGNNLTQAMSDCDKAITLDPAYSEAYKNCSIISAKEGDFTQAIHDCDKAIELKPDFAEAYFNRGNAYSNQGNFIQAISDYNKAIELNPDYVEAYGNRGVVYAKQGNFTQAIAGFTQAIELKPDYVEGYNNRGFTYNKQGNYNQAISDYNQALEINPNFADAVNNRAISYYQLKEYDKSWADAHKAEGLGYPVDSQLINALKQALGQVR